MLNTTFVPFTLHTRMEADHRRQMEDPLSPNQPMESILLYLVLVYSSWEFNT